MMSETSTYDGNRPVGAFSSLQTWNTYSWINNEGFYSLVPSSYFDYYQRFVKHWFYWYDGFVPYFHNSQSGMVSTRVAYAILHKLAEKTVGSKLLFDDEGYEDEHSIKIDERELGSVEFIEHWAKNNDFKPTIKQGFEWAYAGGDSILKLDTDGKDLFVRNLRKDNYLIDTDFRGNICYFQSFIYSYTKMIEKNNSEQYYLVEERKYIDDKPMFKISIKKTNSNLTNGKAVDNRTESIPIARLPKDVKNKFKKDYPNTTLDKWKKMPYKDLGIYMIKATKNVSFLPDAPFGESLLSTLISDLMTFDFYKSSVTTNLYTTRDKVILPQGMQTPNLQKPDDFYANQQNWMGGLDSFIYNRIPYTDPEKATPIFIQPELRDWSKIRNLLLQEFAMKLGVDERTISSSIVPQAEKPTAREISVDEDTTTSFVQDKRDLNSNQLNKLINTVLKFYGFKKEKVTLSFSKAGLSNMNNAVTMASILKQNSLGDLKSLLELVWQDKNEKQINNMVEEIERKEKEQQEQKIKEKENTSVEEGIEQQNDNTEYHVPKEKGED